MFPAANVFVDVILPGATPVLVYSAIAARHLQKESKYGIGILDEPGTLVKDVFHFNQSISIIPRNSIQPRVHDIALGGVTYHVTSVVDNGGMGDGMRNIRVETERDD